MTGERSLVAVSQPIVVAPGEVVPVNATLRMGDRTVVSIPLGAYARYGDRVRFVATVDVVGLVAAAMGIATGWRAVGAGRQVLEKLIAAKYGKR
jgi:hypothetical protein